MAGKSVVLMGPPGCGKSTMAGLTAVRKPVHFIDIDRKINAMANLKGALDKKEITFWEVSDPLVEGTLIQRAQELANNMKMSKPPKGWLTLAQMVDDLDKKPDAQNAGTWVIDSLTRAASHLERHLVKVSDNKSGNMRPQDWGAFLKILQETVTIIIDFAKANDKDIIFTVHEKSSEIPGPNTKVIRSKVGDMVQREYLGALDLKIAASVAGQFAIEFGSYFEEVYGLSVDINNDGKPSWTCRVHPDGKRDLRTSFNVTKSEFPCDFREIWK